MALPADFSKIFGSTATGGLTPISDVNYAKGWEYLGANPPEKNDFSYVQNFSDLKAQWLYNYLTTAGNAASRTVGVGASQIPDMNAFASVLGTTGWFALPSGHIVQFGVGSFGNPAASSKSQAYTLPRAYPIEHIATMAVGNTTATSASAFNLIMAITAKTLTGFTLRADTNNATAMNQDQFFNFISVGR